LSPKFISAPHRARDQQRANRLVERGEPDSDAGHHRGDAEQDLRAEGGMDRDGRRAGAELA